MELVLDHGRGYVSADKNKSTQTAIGTIPVDSIYTPVLKVNYTVENTRVGNQTDFDKLTIEVWTDKTITARDALSLGAKILCDHFTLFTDLSETIGASSTVVEHVDNTHRDKVLDMTIEAGSVCEKLQLPQARQHQHRFRPHLQDSGRDDQGPQPRPQVP